MCRVVLSSLFACSCVSSGIAVYSAELRQKLCIQMFITEIVQIQKFLELEINHYYIIAPRYNAHFACFPKNLLNRGF